MVPALHMWTTQERKPAWGRLLSSCGWERKKSGTAVSEMRDGGSKKERSWSYFLLVLDVPFVGGPWVWGVCVWGLILE